MKNQKFFVSAIFAVVILACLPTTALSQSANEIKVANLSGGGSSVKLDVVAANSGSTLTISAPDGRVFSRGYTAGASPEFTIMDKSGERLPDGAYTYELRLSPVMSAGTLEKLKGARGRDDEPEADRASRKRLLLPALVQSGSFTVLNGSVIVAGAFENTGRTASITRPPRMQNFTFSNTMARLRHHPLAGGARPDDVIPDDLIVQGSACVGLDCVNGEVFGFDTVRLKENNTRLQFDDTSTSQGFATNNWQIRANDSNSGGSSFLGFVDQGSTGNSETGTIVGRFDAGAPANSLRVASNGKIGLRTATPVLDIHMITSDTPATRFEQNNSGGFSAQTWDIAGNEANFFVRDVTSGSLLPFRIRPGAPTSSIDISANGNVGIGTASPAAELHVLSTDNNSFAAELEQTNATASNGLLIKTQTTSSGDVALSVLSNNGATQIISARNNGFVGIGTAAPTHLLSVNGDASKPGGGSWSIFSDERLKNIKGRFNSGLNAVMQLQPLRYEYKPDNALGIKVAGEQIGFGAQSLQKVIPEAVNRNDAGYLTVNNDPILWTMLNAIKEQQQQIAQLKSQVRKLQAASRRRRK